MKEELAHVLRYQNDYYMALRVTRTATSQEIVSSYRRMALHCHPDKVVEAERVHANKAFQILESAKKTLTDAEMRRVYDARGVEGVKRHESGGGGGGGGGFRGGHPMYRQHAAEDIFEQMFGGFQRQQGRHPQQQGGGRGQPVEVNPALLLLPVIMFLLLAMFLQSTIEGSSSRGSGGFGRAQRGLEKQFNIVYDERQGYVVKRKTSLYKNYDAEYDYYVSASWHHMAEDGRIDLRRTEAEVLAAWRDSLGRQCEAETLRRRSRGDQIVPQRCVEYDKLRRLVR